MDMIIAVIRGVILFAVIFSAVVPHEYAHGWVAYKLGDPTAKMAGRLSFNPIKHIDPVGTILLPGILVVAHLLGAPPIMFGWAKPVPVNFMRLKNPKRDMIWVGIAGPVVNIALAFLFSQLLRPEMPLWILEIARDVVFINLLLAIFNMIPIPPLDGSRLVMGLLPRVLAIPYARLERYGIPIVFVLVALGLFHKIILPLVDLCAQLLGVKLL